MKLHTLKANTDARSKPKIVGRGIGSGMGKTSTRGHKGQGARKSGNVRIGFEGGQTPLLRRIPKRGFNNFDFQINYCTVNLDTLQKTEDNKAVNLQSLIAQKLIKLPKSQQFNLKILGNGLLSKSVDVIAHKATASAKAKIEAAGGKLTIIESNITDNKAKYYATKKARLEKQAQKKFKIGSSQNDLVENSEV